MPGTTVLRKCLWNKLISQINESSSWLQLRSLNSYTSNNVERFPCLHESPLFSKGLNWFLKLWVIKMPFISFPSCCLLIVFLPVGTSTRWWTETGVSTVDQSILQVFISVNKDQESGGCYWPKTVLCFLDFNFYWYWELLPLLPGQEKIINYGWQIKR